MNNQQNNSGMYFSPQNNNVQRNPAQTQNVGEITAQERNLILANNYLGVPNIQLAPFGVPSVTTYTTTPVHSLQLPNISNVVPSYICNVPVPCLVPYNMTTSVASGSNSKDPASLRPNPCQPAIMEPPSTNICSCRVSPDRGFQEPECNPCSKIDCPLSLRLQAIASQLLSINGVFSGVINRLICKKLPNSNVTSTQEQILAQAKECINALSQEQLVEELKKAQQISSLIMVHISVESLTNSLPFLTLLQLQVNTLKTYIEELLSREKVNSEEERKREAHDKHVLSLKSDDEIRETLAALRQREYDLNISISFSPHDYQRKRCEELLKSNKKMMEMVENEVKLITKRRRQEFQNAAKFQPSVKRYFG